MTQNGVNAASKIPLLSPSIMRNMARKWPVPVDDADRSATALAAIGELKAEDKRAGSMRSYGL